MKRNYKKYILYWKDKLSTEKKDKEFRIKMLETMDNINIALNIEEKEYLFDLIEKDLEREFNIIKKF